MMAILDLQVPKAALKNWMKQKPWKEWVAGFPPPQKKTLLGTAG